MKHFTVEEIVKIMQKLLEHGWGELHIEVRDHKIPRCVEEKSLKPEEEGK